MSKLDKIFTYFRYVTTIKVPYRSLYHALKQYENTRLRVVSVRFYDGFVEIDVMPR